MSDKSAEEMVGVKSAESWHHAARTLEVAPEDWKCSCSLCAITRLIQLDAYTVGKRAGMESAADIATNIGVGIHKVGIIDDAWCYRYSVQQAILTAAGKVGT